MKAIMIRNGYSSYRTEARQIYQLDDKVRYN